MSRVITYTYPNGNVFHFLARTPHERDAEIRKLKRRERKPKRTLFEIKIKQGTVLVHASNEKHAEFQARGLERDLKRDRYGVVRHQTMIEDGVFALGTEAKRKLGVDVWSCG